MIHADLQQKKHALIGQLYQGEMKFQLFKTEGKTCRFCNGTKNCCRFASTGEGMHRLEKGAGWGEQARRLLPE
jgi:hypothetical protein